MIIQLIVIFEFQRKKRFCYEYYNDSTCLVETDEEPPHDLCEDSIDIALTMTRFLKSNAVDEIHPMRKIVIDGSNTTGFQRTSIIATGGEAEIGHLGSALGRSDFGIAAHVPDENHLVDHRSSSARAGQRELSTARALCAPELGMRI